MKICDVFAENYSDPRRSRTCDYGIEVDCSNTELSQQQYLHGTYSKLALFSIGQYKSVRNNFCCLGPKNLEFHQAESKIIIKKMQKIHIPAKNSAYSIFFTV